MLGAIAEEGNYTGKVAFVSVANDSDHPLQMVVNAFTRRGVKVYKTKGNVIRHSKNMPDREVGWVMKDIKKYFDDFTFSARGCQLLQMACRWLFWDY